jgi:hypothetical protein
MTTTLLPASICPKIVPKLAGSVQAVFVDTTSVYNPGGYTIAGATGATTLAAVDNGGLGTACNAGVGNGNVTLVLVFGR